MAEGDYEEIGVLESRVEMGWMSLFVEWRISWSPSGYRLI